MSLDSHVINKFRNIKISDENHFPFSTVELFISNTTKLFVNGKDHVQKGENV